MRERQPSELSAAAASIKSKGFHNLAEHQIETPFGAPSDSIVGGTMFRAAAFTFFRDTDADTGFCRMN